MLEIHNVQKSSEPRQGDSVGKVYLDAEQALRDFDSESPKTEHQVDNETKDAKLASYLAHARVLMRHRDFGLALNLLRQASNRNSKNPVTLQMLADCLEKTAHQDEALIVCRALVKYDYGFESLHRYATALYKAGQDQESLDKYYEALSVLKEENEHLFEVYKNMGNIFVKKGDFEAAEEYYNKAYTVNPLSDVLLVNFGTLEVQRNDFDKSLYCFRKAVEINPENDKAWVGLAMVHNQFGDTELAWANVQAAFDINPQNRTTALLAANWAVRDSEPQKGIGFLQSYLSEVEQDEEMSLVLINLYCMSGLIDSALIEMEKVLLWNPANQAVRELKKKLSATSEGLHV